MIGRLPIAKMLAVTVALAAAISVVMLQIHWNGQEASTAAPEIDELLNVMIVISSFVFSLVMVMLFYALWKFKAKPGDESDGEPIHGNTRLEIAWTLIPTVIVLFGAGYSWKVLNDIEAVHKNPMTVDVFAQQYAWSFGYPGKGDADQERHRARHHHNCDRHAGSGWHIPADLHGALWLWPRLHACQGRG
jgi:cytochrome c oxidase subunit 2